MVKRVGKGLGRVASLYLTPTFFVPARADFDLFLLCQAAQTRRPPSAPPDPAKRMGAKKKRTAGSAPPIHTTHHAAQVAAVLVPRRVAAQAVVHVHWGATKAGSQKGCAEKICGLLTLFSRKLFRVSE